MIDCIYKWYRINRERSDANADYTVNWEELMYSSNEWKDNKIDEAKSFWEADVVEDGLDYTIDYFYDAGKNNWTHEEMEYIDLHDAINNAEEKEIAALQEADETMQRSFPHRDTKFGTLVTFGDWNKATLNINTMEWVR